MSAARARGARLWVTRLGLAVVAGLGTGVITAFIGLRVLEGGSPPPVVVPDEPEAPTARRTIRGPRADGMRQGGSAMVGGGVLASRDSVAVVPDLVGRAEGDARRLLERAGFEMGSVMFQSSDEPLGTVLETFPVRGERVQLPATVNLILADRRREPEVLPVAPDPDTLGLRSPIDTVPPVPAPNPDPEPDEMSALDSLFLLPDTARQTGAPDSLHSLPDSAQ